MLNSNSLARLTPCQIKLKMKTNLLDILPRWTVPQKMLSDKTKTFCPSYVVVVAVAVAAVVVVDVREKLA